MKTLLKGSFMGLLVCAGLLAGCAPRSTAAGQGVPRIAGLQGASTVNLAGQPVYYEVGGSGPALVFIHGIGGGNSGYQWVKNAPAFVKTHRVYVLDLPGFGRSTPREQNYTAELYVNTLTRFLEEVVGGPADVVASSLAGAYSIKMADQRPEWIRSLTLVTPTGITELSDAPDAAFYQNLTSTPLGDLLAAALRGRFSVSFFLKQQVYLDQSRVTNELKKLYQNNLNQPNAQHPVFSFISGYSNLPIAQEWSRLKQPAMLVWGSDDVNTPLSSAQNFVQARPEVPLHVLKARAIPNDEQSDAFNALLGAFLKTASP